MSEFISNLLFVTELLVLIYLGSTALYILVFSLASLFPLKTKKPVDFKQRRFAVIIPCYQEDEVIIEVANDATKQLYPRDYFDVIVVADKFEKKTINKLKQLDIILFDEHFEISTKTRAINHALRQLPENKYDIAVILDADNLMEPNFLGKLNNAFSYPYTAIQAHRTAKNLNTSFAVLDAVSEEINNNIFRKGHAVLGLSSALIGSAMAFRYDFFKDLMKDIEVVGGFDKELELRLLRDKHLIAYLPDAVVMDEKVQNVQVFAKQRRRWLSAQFHYFGVYFIPALKALLRQRNLDYFNKAYHYIQLPRIMLLGLIGIAALGSLFISNTSFQIAWFTALLFVVLALLLATPRKFYNFQTLQAIFTIPKGFLFMLLSLFSIRGANKAFIHTKHTYNAFQIKKHPKKGATKK